MTDATTLVIAAVEVAEEFFAKKTLVFRTRGRKRDVNEDYVTDRSGGFAQLPLIVLIDESSASAAEALAGSLQDHDRALIIGRRSFGKALMQSSFFLESGDVVRLTIGHVLTPSGRLIQRPFRGLTVERYRAEAGQAENPDTLPVYKTGNGRPVRGGGGIRPDVALPAPPELPVWWSVAADRGWTVAIADSVAYTLAEGDESRRQWNESPTRWRESLLAPLFARVSQELDVASQPEPALAQRIARLLAARAAEVRWGPAARLEFELIGDPDIAAALQSFPELSTRLMPPSGGA